MNDMIIVKGNVLGVRTTYPYMQKENKQPPLESRLQYSWKRENQEMLENLN